MDALAIVCSACVIVALSTVAFAFVRMLGHVESLHGEILAIARHIYDQGTAATRTAAVHAVPAKKDIFPPPAPAPTADPMDNPKFPPDEVPMPPRRRDWEAMKPEELGRIFNGGPDEDEPQSRIRSNGVRGATL